MHVFDVTSFHAISSMFHEPLLLDQQPEDAVLRTAAIT